MKLLKVILLAASWAWLAVDANATYPNWGVSRTNPAGSGGTWYSLVYIGTSTLLKSMYQWIHITTLDTNKELIHSTWTHATGGTGPYEAWYYYGNLRSAKKWGYAPPAPSGQTSAVQFYTFQDFVNMVPGDTIISYPPSASTTTSIVNIAGRLQMAWRDFASQLP